MALHRSFSRTLRNSVFLDVIAIELPAKARIIIELNMTILESGAVS
jgi:hypothetical protein